jgi:thymidylate kinase
MAYVMIEGPEGAGKTEGVASLFASLKAMGYDAMVVHEPGNGTLGTLVRSTLSGIKREHHEHLKAYVKDGSMTEHLFDNLTRSGYKGPDALDTIIGDYSKLKELMRDGSTLDRLLGALASAKEIDIESLQLLFTAVRSEDMKRLGPFLARKDLVVISDRGYPSTITYAESNGPNKDYVDFLKYINSRFPKPDLLFVLYAPPEVLLNRVQKRGGTAERFDELETIRNIGESYRRNYADAFYVDASQSREEVHKRILDETKRLLRKLAVQPVYPADG